MQKCQSGHVSHQTGFRLMASLIGFHSRFFRIFSFFWAHNPGQLILSGSKPADPDLFVQRSGHFISRRWSPAQRFFCFSFLGICTRTVPVFAKGSRPLMALKSTTPQGKSSKSSYLSVIQPDSCPHTSYTGMSKGPRKTPEKKSG